MTFAIGERVWWHHTGATVLYGTIQVLEDRPGVKPDNDRDLLYLDADQLHRMEPGVYAGLDENGYHSDRGSLSQSGAKLLLPPSCPAKFRYTMDNPPEPKPHLDFGQLAHRVILGQGPDLALIDADDWRTKDARAQRDYAREQGKLPVLGGDYRTAVLMRGAIREHPIAGPLFSQGDPELSLYAHDPDTGTQLRGRIDWLTFGTTIGLGQRVIIADYKTCQDANPAELPRTAAKWNYALQFAWYITLSQLLGLADDPIFLLIFQEKEPPHLVNVVELDADAYTHGRQQMRQAINTYAQCQETGEWPGYGDGIQSISLPTWAVHRQTIGELLEGVS